MTRAEFRDTGFTQAHLERARLTGWRMVSTLVTEVGRLLRRGEPFVYAYYEGVDKVAHEYGLGEHYDAELVAVDRLVADLLDGAPGRRGAGRDLRPRPGRRRRRRSSPRRRRCWPTRPGSPARGASGGSTPDPGQARALLDAACEHHADTAWVVDVQTTIDQHWFGPVLGEAARASLGDVALVAREPVAYDDPADTGPFQLRSRHGSLTSAEMLVPLLVGGG